MIKNSINDIKELCEYIWDLEDKYDLFNLEVNGINPWAAYRMDIYFELAKKFGIFDKKINLKTSKIDKVIYFFRLLKNSITYYKDYKFKKVDALIFSWGRTKKIKNKLIDPYTYYLKKKLNKQKISFLEFESPYKGKHIRKKKSYKIYLDKILILRNILNLLVKTKIDIKNKKIIKMLSQEINKDNNTTFFDIEQLLISNTKKFIPTYSYYLDILKKTQPKVIYIVVSYGQGELIKAANDLNIEVIELQHGTFSKYHLGYSFPKGYNAKYLPKKFYVWNNYWKNLMSFPIKSENIKIYPCQYLEIEKKKYQNIIKKKNSLIVLSQGANTEVIANKLIENIAYFEKFQITFKLHPNEYHMRSKHKKLAYLQKKYNVSIVTNVDLYEYLAKSEYQAGVFSTALYEGVEFNCKTILLKLPGIEYMDQFIKINKPIIK